jgi:amidase
MPMRSAGLDQSLLVVGRERVRDAALAAAALLVTRLEPAWSCRIARQPAISLPLAWSKSGLPIGVQFVGRFGEEHLLLQLAAQIEKAEPWSTKRPSVYG